MEQTRHVTAIIEREDGGYAALCPELDVASEGATIYGLSPQEAALLCWW